MKPRWVQKISEIHCNLNNNLPICKAEDVTAVWTSLLNILHHLESNKFMKKTVNRGLCKKYTITIQYILNTAATQSFSVYQSYTAAEDIGLLNYTQCACDRFLQHSAQCMCNVCMCITVCTPDVKL